jgi:hypothetical protein
MAVTIIKKGAVNADALAADGAKKYEASAPAPLIPPFVFADTSSPPIHLQHADRLHQPVFGTSKGSKYYVVALGPTVTVAARVGKDNSVGIRAVVKNAGSSSSPVNFGLAGLASKGGHYSVHLKPKTISDAQKSLGAVLFGLQGQFHSVSDRVDLLQKADL